MINETTGAALTPPEKRKAIPASPIELLAPAGDFAALQAAVGNGADSVYFGSTYFNARKKAENIGEDRLAEAIDYLHLRSCRAYLTLNTLLQDDELLLASDLAKLAYGYGIDAIIVQDLGLAATLREELPDLPLHASTQATIFNEAAIDACERIGFSRIILPRELSIPEIARLSAYAKKKGIETEVFVHGALCVCYSGQCLMSSMIGGRSGNRGECAQPCRLPYDITISGRPKNRIAPYLATKDISALGHIGELIDAGVAAIKIEGRMRSPEYVGAAVGEFRKQIRFISAARQDRQTDPARASSSGPALSGEEKGNVENLLLAFNRGGDFSDHFLRGKKSADQMAGAHPGSFGVLLGEIAAKNAQTGILDVRRTSEVKTNLLPEKGDVVAIRRKGGEEEVASAPIGSAASSGINIRIKGFHPAVIENLQPGDLVYRMSFSRLAKESLSADRSKTGLTGVLFEENGRLKLRWTVSGGIAAGLSYEEELDPSAFGDERPDAGSSSSLQEARISAVAPERAAQQLSKTGGTPFSIEDLKIECAPAVPISGLNLLRRESLAGLSEAIVRSFRRIVPEMTSGETTDRQNGVLSASSPAAQEKDVSAIEDLVNQIDILAPERTLSGAKADRPDNQVAAFFYEWNGDARQIACGADWYELPVFDLCKETALSGLKRLKETEPSARIAAVLPPAYTEAAGHIIDKFLRTAGELGIEAVVSGNPGNPWLCRTYGLESFLDLGGNVMNSVCARLMKTFGSSSVAPSAELSLEPLAAIARGVFADADCVMEIPAYGKLRLMYSEHCPIGQNRSGCTACQGGATFALKDRKGSSFPVVCHHGVCTVDILNGDSLCVPVETAFLAKCCRVRARLYFTEETPEERLALVQGFRSQVLSPDSPQAELEAEKIKRVASAIATAHNHGVTRGHYQRGVR